MVKWEGAAGSACRRLVWNLLASTAIICVAAGCTKLSKKSAPKKKVASINYTKQAEQMAPVNAFADRYPTWESVSA